MLIRRLVVVFVIFLLPLASQARSEILPYPDVLDELNYLLTNKDYESAYQTAELFAFDYGGEADFDLLLGFAAYGSQRFQEAVFAFERVSVLRPKVFIGRFFLAQSYNKLGNYAAALAELEKLKKLTLTAEQQNKISSLSSTINRNALSRKTVWYHIVGANLSLDSNINSGTDQDSILIPDLGEIVLFESAKATSDTGYNLSYMGGYQHPIDQNQAIKIDVAASHYGFVENNQFQRQQLALNIALVQDWSFGQVSYSGYTRPLWLEQDVKTDTIDDLTSEPKREVSLYRVETGAGIGFKQKVNKQVNYRFGANVSFVANQISPELDFSRIKLAAGVQYKSKMLHTLNLHYTNDSASDSDYGYNDKSTIGLIYQIALPVMDKVMSSSYVMYESHSYDLQHPIFKAVRSESIIAASSQLNYQYSEHQQFKLQLNIQQKDSNVELFNFNRVETVMGWQYVF
ncbi:hypothetical protein KO525_10545 [Psychrosphaera sp. B3R10]|uniref:tetratricopeptide repeat protein n=1 Tax=unclassified Psychrosphaera TaxID=2641570 RepID=UPI001C09360D|nr:MULTISPECIES: hypothetical protein [unclassified Psychrosphaera]MBU2883639.1 hypothetical protein [Psychrosphaera sp. I2R16]MBU2989817.1 hypothetical protein [Psychrosphaera sp. B3R10]